METENNLIIVKSGFKTLFFSVHIIILNFFKISSIETISLYSKIYDLKCFNNQNTSCIKGNAHSKFSCVLFCTTVILWFTHVQGIQYELGCMQNCFHIKHFLVCLDVHYSVNDVYLISGLVQEDFVLPYCLPSFLIPFGVIVHVLMYVYNMCMYMYTFMYVHVYYCTCVMYMYSIVYKSIYPTV